MDFKFSKNRGIPNTISSIIKKGSLYLAFILLSLKSIILLYKLLLSYKFGNEKFDKALTYGRISGNFSSKVIEK